jgi:hypothetical protein
MVLNRDASLTLRIVASAGATAFGLTVLVETLFGKLPSEYAWQASELAAAAIVSAGALSRWFLRAALIQKSLWRCLAIASVGLLIVYPIFAALHALLTDGARSVSEVAGAGKVVSVFAIFSAPIAWPVTLLLAWLWYRRIGQNVNGRAS